MSAPMADARESRLFIDGQLRDAADGRCFTVSNPADLSTVHEVSDATNDDVRAAVAAAQRASAGVWPRDAELRANCIRQLQRGLEQIADPLRQTLVAESGTPIALTYAFQLDWPVRDLT